ncbi:MAG: hypothetical protein Q8L47_00685 [bacterium]|nr:hypothetical protein [bacterium]
MVAHYLQLIVNLSIFVVGGFIFWHYGGSDNIFESSLYEHTQAFFGIVIMIVAAYVTARPCEHSSKEPDENENNDHNESIPDLEINL